MIKVLKFCHWTGAKSFVSSKVLKVLKVLNLIILSPSRSAAEIDGHW
jgi:hypothetical protein